MRNTLSRYSFALVTVGVAFGLRLLLAPLTGNGVPFALFFAATLVTSVFAGTGPGICALGLSLPLAAYAFIVRAGYPVDQALIRALLYGADGVVIIYLAALVNRRRRTLDAANLELRRLGREASRAAARTGEVIELAPDAFLLADLDGRYIDVNEAACRLLGYEHAELIGKTLFDLIPSEDAARLTALRTELLVPGAVSKTEWRLKRKDGSVVPVETSSNMLRDGRWQAFVRDITDRKRIEDQRQVFVSLLDNSVDFVGIADPAGKPIYLNAAGRRMIGLRPDFPVEELQIQDCYPSELRTFVTDVLLPTMREEGVWSGETFFRNFETQERIPVSDTHFLIRDATGQRILGMGTVTRDISEAQRIAEERERLLAREQTARRQAESANAKLRESEERFRLTIDEAPIGMALVSLDGRFVRVNRVLCEITGYTAAELMARTFHEITHPEDVDKDVALANDLARGKYPRYQLEKRYIRKDGSVVNVMLSAAVLRGPEGAPLYYIAQVEDITERKLAERALRRSKAALQRAIKTRDDVLRIVAHDLRNPLSAIMMQAAAMERAGDEPERRDPAPRQLIQRAADRMNQLIQDLLNVALVEAGQLKVEPARLSVSDLLGDALRMQKPLASAAKVELRDDLGPEVSQVWGDRRRLLQVLDNLVGNAIKFTEPGGRIVVSAAVNADEVVFSVADTGRGIARDALPHIFDRFWQAASQARRLGAGLGLPITRGIVEAHGGRIWVESRVGRGSTFFFAIPTPCTRESAVSPA